MDNLRSLMGKLIYRQQYFFKLPIKLARTNPLEFEEHRHPL